MRTRIRVAAGGGDAASGFQAARAITDTLGWSLMSPARAITEKHAGVITDRLGWSPVAAASGVMEILIKNIVPGGRR